MKSVSLFLCLIIFSQVSHAASGLKEALDHYQYNVTVNWDQIDEAQLKKYDLEFQTSIQLLIRQGQSPEELVQEAISLSQDKSLKNDLDKMVIDFKTKNITSSELNEILKDKSDALYAKGASWHPAVKVILGVIGAYVILKAIMLTIYFWDTEDVDCSVQDCSPPPPPKT